MNKTVRLVFAATLMLALVYFSAFAILKTSFHSYTKTVTTPPTCTGDGTGCSLVEIEGTTQDFKATTFKLGSTTNLILIPILLVLLIVGIVLLSWAGEERLGTSAGVILFVIGAVYIVGFSVWLHSYAQNKQAKTVPINDATPANVDCTHYLYFLGSPNDTCHQLENYNNALRLPGM